MATRAEGDCPECSKTLGVQVSDSLAMLAGNQIEDMMKRDDNAIRCTNCGKYVDPVDMTIMD